MTTSQETLLAASRSTVERLADFPRYLRANGNKVLASIVEEELAKHRAAIAEAEGSSNG